jgi:hypothetical protein
LRPGKSFIYFVHARGFIENHQEYQRAVYEGAENRQCRWGDNDKRPCKRIVDLEHCVKYLWSVQLPHSGSKQREDGPYTQSWREFVDHQYRVFPPTPPIKPRLKPAYIARLPITNFVVVRARDNSHEATLASARKRSKYEVEEVDA